VEDYLKQILTSRVYEAALETPLTKAQSISNLLGNTIYLKREDLQPVFSFKLRGAYNKIANLTSEQAAAGIVACSAGNHAQGVAFVANKFKIDAKIVMPVPTPESRSMVFENSGRRWQQWFCMAIPTTRRMLRHHGSSRRRAGFSSTHLTTPTPSQDRGRSDWRL